MSASQTSPLGDESQIIDFVEGYNVGVGVISLNGTSRGCALTLPTDLTPTPNRTQDSDIKLVTSEEELNTYLGISVSVKASYGAASASARTDFTKQFKSTKLSSWVVVRSSVQTSKRELTPIHKATLHDEALKTLTGANGPKRFFQAYGDRYIHSMIYGAEFLAVLQLESESEEMKESLKSSWDVSGGVGKLSASTAGNVESTLSRTHKTSNLRFRCHLTGAVESPAELTIAAVVKFALEFPTRVTAENAVAIRAVLTDYRTLNLPADAALSWPALDQAKNLLSTIHGYVDRLSEQRAAAQTVVAQKLKYRPDERKKYVDIVKEIDDSLRLLASVRQNCCASLVLDDEPRVPSTPPPPKYVQDALPAATAADSLQSGDVIALQADNGLYLSIIGRDGIAGLEAAKATPDPFSQFTVTVHANQSISLMTRDKVYLGAISRGEQLQIEAFKSAMDEFSRFTPEPQSNDKIALKAVSGKYLSRIHRNGRSTIEATKSTIDVFSQFRQVLIRFAGDAEVAQSANA